MTTGPMLDVDFEWSGKGVMVSGHYETANPRRGVVEVVVNGDVSSIPASREGHFKTVLPLKKSSWFAVRVIEEGRHRFAHTAPKHFKVPGRPLRPKPEEVAYLVKRVEDEIERHTGVLDEEALSEYRQALEHYRGLVSE